MQRNEMVTKAAQESKDMDRYLSHVVPVSEDRYTVFTSDRRAVDFANDLVSARAIAKFHGMGAYVKDQNGRIYPQRIR